MTTYSPPAYDAVTELAAGEGAPAVIVFLLVVVGLLVLLVWVVMQMGRRRRDTPQSRDELPTPPDHGTHFESRLEPDEVDPSQGHQTPGRLTPHEMHGYGNMGSRLASAEPPTPPREPDDDAGPAGDHRSG